MKRLLVLTLIIIAIPTFSQQLINTKTKQWLIYKGTDDIGGELYKYSIVTKTEKCEVRNLTIPSGKLNLFIDSLEKNGWTKKITTKSLKNKYHPTLELNSIIFNKMEKNDSIFQFVYKIKLTEIRTGKVMTQLDTLYGQEKNAVLKAISTNDYKFDELEIQKGTAIISLRLRSSELVNVDKNIYYSSRQYFF